MITEEDISAALKALSTARVENAKAAAAHVKTQAEVNIAEAEYSLLRQQLEDQQVQSGG